eukprot:6107738-Amphidinium_carterae.2
MYGRGDIPPPEVHIPGGQEDDRAEDPDAGVEAEVVDYRTRRVPSPSDAETLVLGGTQDQEVEAHEGDYRTPRVPSPNVAETEGSRAVPDGEADTQESDMFASAVSVEESEAAPLPPPPPPVPEVPRQHAEAARLLPYQFHRRNGKVRRSRPRQLDHLQRGMTSY